MSRKIFKLNTTINVDFRQEDIKNFLPNKIGEVMIIVKDIKILFVDSHDNQRDYYKRCFQKNLGYVVYTASCPSSAEEILYREKPDIMVTSLKFSGVGFYEILQNIQEKGDLSGLDDPTVAAIQLMKKIRLKENQEKQKRLPIIIFTAYDGKMWDSLYAGADLYLAKPRDLEKLDEHIEKLLMDSHEDWW